MKSPRAPSSLFSFIYILPFILSCLSESGKITVLADSNEAEKLVCAAIDTYKKEWLGTSDTDGQILQKRFELPDHLCNYRCSPGASVKFTDFCISACRCQTDLPATRRRRYLLQERQISSARRLEDDGEFIFANCGGKEIKMFVDANHPFKSVSESLLQLRKTSLVASRMGETLPGGDSLNTPVFAGCQLFTTRPNVSFSGLNSETSGFTFTSVEGASNLTDTSENTEWRVPYAVRVWEGNFSSTLHESLIRLAGGSWYLRYVPENPLLMEIPLYSEVAAEIQRLPEIKYAVPIPSAMKVKESLLNQLSKLTAETLPDVEIHLEPLAHVNAESFVAGWNEKLLAMWGIKGALSTGAHKRIILSSMENVKYFARVLQEMAATGVVAGIQLAPNWQYFGNIPGEAARVIPADRHILDFLPKVQSFLPPSYRTNKRRHLVEGINDILGVTEMHAAQITGKGIVATCSDSGAYMYHDQYQQSAIPYEKVDTSQRKVILYMQQAGNGYDSSDLANDTCGHGTHVCGILAGKSATDKGNIGIAFDAKLVIGDIGGDKDSSQSRVPIVPPKIPDVFGPINDTGSRIFSFSWGTTGANDYDIDSLGFDSYLHQNPDMIVFFAIGNSGNGLGANGKLDPGEVPNCSGGYTSSPSMAKNVISIGASVNLFPSDSCIAYQPNVLAHFSSWGPAPGKRRKPDIICPGFQVTSAMSLPRANFIQQVKGSGTCTLSGTSQSCPACAGIGILVYQWLAEGRWKAGKPDPSAAISRPTSALVKALLIQTSLALKGVLPDPKILGSSPTCSDLQRNVGPTVFGDFKQGFGRVNGPALLKLTPGSFIMSPNSSNIEAVGQGEQRVYSFTVDSRSTFRATLVWTDPPTALSDLTASICTSQIVNDLDLEVSEELADGSTTTYLPVASDGTTAVDRGVNNVEVVQVESQSKGGSRKFLIKVKGFKVKGSQTYSLVASGLSTTVALDTAALVGESGIPRGVIYAAVVGSIVLVAAIAGFLVLRMRRRRAEYDRRDFNGDEGDPRRKRRRDSNDSALRSPTSPSSTAFSRSPAGGSRANSTASPSLEASRRQNSYASGDSRGCPSGEEHRRSPSMAQSNNRADYYDQQEMTPSSSSVPYTSVDLQHRDGNRGPQLMPSPIALRMGDKVVGKANDRHHQDHTSSTPPSLPHAGSSRTLSREEMPYVRNDGWRSDRPYGSEEMSTVRL